MTFVGGTGGYQEHLLQPLCRAVPDRGHQVPNLPEVSIRDRQEGSKRALEQRDNGPKCSPPSSVEVFGEVVSKEGYVQVLCLVESGRMGKG